MVEMILLILLLLLAIRAIPVQSTSGYSYRTLFFALLADLTALTRFVWEL